MRRSFRLLLLGSSLVLSAASLRAEDAAPVELQLAAASSLRDALNELAPAFERATGAKLVLNLGASSDLARQILAANKADLFFSADEAWMDRVAEAGLVDASSRRSPLSNRLAVVVPNDGAHSLAAPAELASPGFRRIALADPGSVPAGKYAKAWLESKGLWEAVAPRVVPAMDVRAALAAVESGAVDAGIVYRTDAAITKRVLVAFEVPEGEGPRISYALAAMADRPHLDRARAAVEWLCGAEATRVFARLGFVIPGAR